MQIVFKKTKELWPYSNNCRTENSSILRKSIEEFGFVQPLIINQDNEIVCGLMRYKVAKELKIAELPCIVVDWSKEKCSKFRLVDNKVSEKSNWDWCNLDKELHKFDDNLKSYTFIMDEFEDFPNIDKVFALSKQEELF